MKNESSVSKNFKRRFGLNITTCRHSLGFTREELAERAGISPQNLAKIENGQRFFSSESLLRLASALEVTVADLFIEDIPKSKTANISFAKIEKLLKTKSSEDIDFAHKLLTVVFKKISKP